MRCNAAARSKARRQDEGGISLFPFLSVLICTMGMLILLLIVLARHARIEAAEAAQTKMAEEEINLKQSREDAQWRIDQLKTSLQTAQTQLANARLELGHLEDHSRELRRQLTDQQKALQQLDVNAANSEQRRAMEDQLRQLQSQIVEAERRVEAARQASQKRAASYSVVPYQGPNGTRRRPIYIECRADVVVMQPEGAAFVPSDFEGNLGPDNPLAAALRAAREHLLRRGEIAGDGTSEPYPLLLVRPSGIEAYYATRDAMQSWGAEFGYELIGEDWNLSFPPADPELTQTLKREIASARQRQERLAEAAPSAYRGYRASEGRGPTQYTVSSGKGGVVPYGNVDEATSDGPRFGKRTSAAAKGTSDQSGSGGPYAGGGSTETGLAGPELGGQGQTGSNGAGSTSGSGTPSAAGTEATHGGFATQKPAPAFGQAPSTEDTASRGEALLPGEWRPTDPRARAPREDSDADSPGQQASRSTKSMAKTRGHNWGLPDASPHSTPLAQPIRIECHPDRLVIVAQEGRGGKTIPLGPATAASIDDFVSGVWAHMETWGIAGNHMYWKPILNVYVAPGGEKRFTDLDALLKDSGLTVERKGEL